MTRGCRRPPIGWVCHLEAHHTGPCPTYARWWNMPARIAWLVWAIRRAA